MKIEKYLLKIGIQPHLKGFYLLADAIDLVIKDRSYLRNITKKLYVELADTHDETPTTVERAMRHAIQTSTKPHNLTVSGFVSKCAIEMQTTEKGE